MEKIASLKDIFLQNLFCDSIDYQKNRNTPLWPPQLTLNLRAFKLCKRVILVKFIVVHVPCII